MKTNNLNLKDLAAWLIEVSNDQFDSNRLFDEDDQRWIVGNAQAAIVLAELAVRVDKTAETLYGRAFCRLQFRDNERAYADLKEALKLSKDYKMTHIICRKLGELSSGKERDKYYNEANDAWDRLHSK
ncbi:MAG: hypothetical protein KDD49_03910 [Bacteroidetes bacterium]|nr:hypothetical protein [Bacteroidota bacterium]